jgi:hypothetical protein
MSKIITLRPNRETIRPVLTLLTSHRIDCILLCLRSLERFTNLGRFKKIYIVANAVDPDHAAIIHRFMYTHENVEVIHCSPRGLAPAVNSVQNEILARHVDDVIVKMDEDVFVAPLWLEHLLEGYQAHRIREDIPVVSALSPVSPTGRFALNRFLKNNNIAERAMFEGGVVEENWVYHRWMWEKVTGEDFVEAWLASNPQPYFYPGFATLNCVVYDRRLIEAVLPLPTAPGFNGVPYSTGSDGLAVNAALAANKWKNAVVSRAIAHHYSFSKCEEYLRSHVPLDIVWQYLQELWRQERIKAQGFTTRKLRPVLTMAGSGA